MVSNKSNESNESPLIKYDTVLIVSRHFDIFTSWIDKKEKDSYYDIKDNPYKFNALVEMVRRQRHFIKKIVA